MRHYLTYPQDSKRWKPGRYGSRFVHRDIGTAPSGMWNVVYRGAYRSAKWRTKHELDGHWVCWR